MRVRGGIGWVLGIAAVSLAAAGCSRDAGALDRRDENHPLLRRAIAAKRANDPDGAIDLFNRALEKRPDLARAHLELALIYDQEPKEDFVRAVYHYERYLEMRPGTEARPQVEALAKRARLSYAASLPDRPSEAIRMIADLQRETDMLRRELQAAQEKARGAAAGAARTAGGGTSAPPRGAASAGGSAARGGLSAPAPAPAASAAHTYTVVSGDTLSTIAAKVYNDRQAWRRIFEANRGVLSGSENVRPGQVLVIPTP